MDPGSPTASVTATVGVWLFFDGKPDTPLITLLDASGDDDAATRKAFEGVGSGKSRGRWREATEGYVRNGADTLELTV